MDRQCFKASVEITENNLHNFSVEMESSAVEKIVSDFYNKNIKPTFAARGFRKGNVPLNIFIRKGLIKIDAEVKEKIFNSVFSMLMLEYNIKPVLKPEITYGDLNLNYNFKFSFKIMDFPTIQELKYKDLELPKTQPVIVTDEIVNKEIFQIISERVSIDYDSIDDIISRVGDKIIIDYTGTLDDKALDHKGQNEEIIIGDYILFKEFEDQLIGHKKGDSINIEVLFPHDYDVSEIADRTVTFSVVFKDVQRKVLPLVNDDFVKKYFKRFKSFDDFKKAIIERLTERYKKEAEVVDKNLILDNIKNNHSIEIDNFILEYHTNKLLAEFEERLKLQKITLLTYLETINKTFDSFKESIKASAIKNLTERMILSTIAKCEKINTSEDELVEYFHKLNSNYSHLSLDNITLYLKDKLIMTMEELTNKKVVERLLHNFNNLI